MSRPPERSPTAHWAKWAYTHHLILFIITQHTDHLYLSRQVFTAQLKSKHGETKWTLAGVCLFLDVVL
jgi:hypothetical protein